MTKQTVVVAAALVLGGRVGYTQAPGHAPDGGVTQTLISIFVPPLPNAPFSATVNTEWTRALESGGTQVIKNHRLIARDARGRVFQERRMLAPDGSPTQSRLLRTELAEAATHTIAVCDPYAHACDLRLYTA